MSKPIITACGDDCSVCPRYTAKSELVLQNVAKLWYKMGWRDRIVTNEEIRCNGCSTENNCTYQLLECIEEHKINKCNQCIEYPCNKIRNMIDRTHNYEMLCKERCTEDEFKILKQAFFEKEMNLEL